MTVTVHTVSLSVRLRGPCCVQSPLLRRGLTSARRPCYRDPVSRQEKQHGVPDGSVASDEALVQAMAAGQRDALGQLYDRYAGLLLAAGQRILRNPKEAEDLVHDVFLEAWKSAQAFDPARGSVRTWLLVRLRCRALDRFRAADVAHKHHGELAAAADDAPERDDPTLSPDRARVHRALRGLPSEQRQVLELGYFEGLSSTEIAARMQVPVGTVKSRVKTALTKLRADLVPDAPAGDVP